jgi:hypothetical protein
MGTSIEWCDPKVVFEWDKQQVKSIVANLWLITTKWTWLLWVVALPVAYYWGPLAYAPQVFSRWFKTLFFMGLFFPTAFSLLIGASILPKLLCKTGDRYELNDEGVFRHSLVLPLKVSWKRIEIYRFAEHEELSNIRVLQFKIKGIKRWYQFSFDPQEIKENEIAAVLNNNLSSTS